MEGIRKRVRPGKRWTDDVEEDLKIMEIRNWHIIARNWKELKSITYCTARGGGGGGGDGGSSSGGGEIMLHMACKRPLLGTFFNKFYMELKDCIAGTKVPSLRTFFFSPLTYLLHPQLLLWF